MPGHGKTSYKASYFEHGSASCPLIRHSEHTSSSTEPIPDDLEEEELRDYAERYAVLADFADLDDVDFTGDDWAALSEVDVLDLSHQIFQPQIRGTSDMDVS